MNYDAIKTAKEKILTSWLSS